MITVVVPVYNGLPLLSEALASIAGQRHPELEVLVVDDGSTDGLDEAAVANASLPGARYLRQENQGPAAARNLGIRHAQGGLVAFLDADDRWAPGHLDRLQAALAADPAAGIAQGRMRQFVVDPASGAVSQSGAYRMPYLGSCLFRRWVFERCGGFDESMRFGEDYDFLFRCWEQDIVKCHVEEVSLLYRRHDGNMTRGHDNHAHVVVAKRRLERIRQGRVDPSQPRRAVFQHYIGDTREFDQWTR